MTEQENQNKIKVVNELNNLISNICKKEHPCRRRRCQDCKLDYIADYILRKEEEAQKEATKKLLAEITKPANTITKLGGYVQYVLHVDDIDKLTKEFGVEVDE